MPIPFCSKISLALAFSTLLSITPALAHDKSAVWGVTTPTTVAFNWHANGTLDSSVVKARKSLRRYQVINGSSSWICSPAGFGRRSTCYSI